MSTQETHLNLNRIKEMIPHRDPMLMIDEVRDIVTGQSALGIKNVAQDEPVFEGHFPEHPIFPGVLIVEAMAQTAAVLVVHTLGKDSEGKLVYFMTIDDARFRRPVGPGDQIKIFVDKIRQRGNVWKFTGEATVNGKVCSQATFSAMIMDREE